MRARRWSTPLGAPLAVWCTIIAAACGSGSGGSARPAIDVPRREPTAGDALLAVIPAGADALLEIDLARLRDNPKVGPLVRALAGSGQVDLGFDIVRDADLVLIASYGIGESGSAKITIVRGARAREIAGAQPLGKHTIALATPALARRIEAVRAGQEPSLRQSSELLRVRALAMPEGAKTATVRASAVLDFDARVSLAREHDLDAVPRTLSLWGDVADDLALVARLEADDKKEAKQLGRAVERVRDRVADSEPLRRLIVGYVVRGAQVSVRGTSARAVLVVGPHRLQRIVTRLLKKFAEGKEAS